MTITPTLDRAVQTANSVDAGPTGDDQFEPQLVTLDDGRFVVFWTDDSGAAPGDTAGVDILAQVFDASGGPVGAARRVNVGWHADDEHDFSVAALPGGGFVVAYEDEDLDGVSIRADEFTVNADHSLSHVRSPSILVDPGADILSGPRVSARADGTYMVTYARTTSGSRMDVYGKTVNGDVISGEFSVILDSDDVFGSDHLAMATLANGNYVIISEYEEYPDGEQSLAMRILNSAGGEVLPATWVGNTHGGGFTESEPAVAALSGGGFVVVWSEYDGTDSDILFQIFDANGASVAGPTGVDSSGTTQQNNEPSVVALKDGGFFVVFDHDESDSIRGKRFDGSGNAVGATVTIADTAAAETEPVVQLTPDGRIVVAWTVIAGSNNDIKVAIYDPRTGTYVGTGQGDLIFGRQDGLGQNGDFRILGESGADTILGRNASDDIEGGGGDDFIDGAGGDDTIEGNLGADALNGGAGADMLVYDSSPTGVVVRLWNQTATGGAATGDVISGFEDVVGSNFGGDAIVGSDSVANYLSGLDFNDSMQGLSGNDTLRGGAGADNMNGGVGIDTVDYGDATTRVTVRLWNQTATDGIATGDVLAGFENVTGGAAGDAIVGADASNNVLDGAGGSDTMQGLSGNDTLRGGAGADRLDGGAGVDTLDYSDAVSKVVVRLWNQTASGDVATGDTIAGFERVLGGSAGDAIVGSSGVANYLVGAGGNDNMQGLSGNDTLVGGAGNDTLTGGADNDRFDFAPGSGADRITDFVAGPGAGDVLRITGFGGALNSFLEILAVSTQVGADTVINLGGGSTITLISVLKTNLNADDFVFG